tara:strand:+ start:1060 stop:1764 length:705 start_codon:yes stop_codon:yes gene_type:complete
MLRNSRLKSKRIDVFDDFLDPSTLEEIHNSSLKHYERNLMSSDFVDITNSIIDCHGLKLSTTAYFPYDENCWNILSLAVKEKVADYVLDEYGFDRDYVIPYSCWGERVDSPQSYVRNDKIKDALFRVQNKSKYGYGAYDDPRFAKDDYGDIHIIRTILHVVVEDVENNTGLRIYFDKESTKVDAKKNRLIIFDAYSYKNHVIYPIKEINKERSYIIFFDWFINDPFRVPDWILP